MVGNPDTRQLEEFDRFIAQAKEAMKVVRELGRQHKLRRWANGPHFPKF